MKNFSKFIPRFALVSLAFGIGSFFFLALSPLRANAQNTIMCQGVGQTPIPCNMGPTATTDLSTAVTVGGTFQTVQAITLTRNSIEFQNNCNISGGGCVATTDNCYIYFGVLGSATKIKSVVVAAGSYYLRSTGSIPSDAINVTCDGTADPFMLKVQ